MFFVYRDCAAPLVVILCLLFKIALPQAHVCPVKFVTETWTIGQEKMQFCREISTGVSVEYRCVGAYVKKGQPGAGCDALTFLGHPTALAAEVAPGGRNPAAAACTQAGGNVRVGTDPYGNENSFCLHARDHSAISGNSIQIQ